MAFQRRNWAFERVAWLALAFLLVGGLLGLFSQGPFSGTTMSDPTGQLRVDYQFFERMEADTDITVRVRRDPGPVALIYGAGLFQGFSITSVHPQPRAASGGGARLRHEFESTGGDLLVRLTGRMRRPGLMRGTVQIEDGPTVSFAQFVYP